MMNGSIEKTGSENDTNPSSYSSSECIAFLTVAITQSVAIVTLNILTIIVFVRNRSLRKRSMYLVINLAVADMLVGGYTEVINLVQFGNRVCNVWSGTVNLPCTGVWGCIIFHVFPLASLTNLAVISLERMHATFRPFKHRVIKIWVFGVVITVTWVLAGLFSTAVELKMVNKYVRRWNLHMSIVLICLFIIFVSYTSIVMKVYYGVHPQHHGAVSRETKLTKTLFIVTLVSLTSMAWLPYVVIGFLYSNSIISTSRVFVHLLDTLIFLYYTNSLVNPILYTIRVPEFRRALISLFRRQHRSVHTEIPLRVIPYK